MVYLWCLCQVRGIISYIDRFNLKDRSREVIYKSKEPLDIVRCSVVSNIIVFVYRSNLVNEESLYVCNYVRVKGADTVTLLSSENDIFCQCLKSSRSKYIVLVSTLAKASVYTILVRDNKVRVSSDLINDKIKWSCWDYSCGSFCYLKKENQKVFRLVEINSKTPTTPKFIQLKSTNTTRVMLIRLNRVF